MNCTRSLASQRTTQIIDVLKEATKPLQNIEVANMVGLDRSTTYSILTSLKMKGIIEKASKGRPKVFMYAITGRVFDTEKPQEEKPLQNIIAGIPVTRRIKGDISITLPRLMCLEGHP